jgi:DNA-binding NtrC family response regulator
MTSRDSTETQVASVLIIDDDPNILQSVGRAVERLGYTVHRAASGEDGIQLWRRYRPTVTLCDLFLPGIDGFAVLEQLSQEKAVVIVFSGQGQIQEAVRAMRRGAENFLTKPIELEHLAQAIERAVEKAQMVREIHQLHKQVAKRRIPWVARVVLVALVVGAVWVGLWLGEYLDPSLEPAPPLFEIPSETTGQPGDSIQ